MPVGQDAFVRIGDQERRYVDEVLNSQFSSASGSVMTGRLERLFAETYGTRFAVSFINGTATLHAALVAAGVGPGDEVIVPPLTMASTSFAVLQAGATPVFADIHPLKWTLDPASVADHLTDRTRAVIPVGIYDLPADLDEILAMAADKNLFVLEDNAQCVLGAITVGADPSSVVEPVRALLADPARIAAMSAAGRRAVDGRGAERVARAIMELAATPGAS